MANVSDIYGRVCRRMLEPAGFTLGKVADTDFCKALAIVIVDFMNRTGVAKQINSQQVVSGTSTYSASATTLRVEHVLVGGVYLGRTNRDELDCRSPEWAASTGPPVTWHEDGLAVGALQLVPTPDYTGTALPGGLDGEPTPSQRNLTTVGARRPNDTSYTTITALSSTIPNGAVPYLAWGVLEKLLSNDDENKDLARAAYCQARFEEGVALYRSIMREAMLDDAEETF